jgi:HlyD family secretion protein
MRRLLTKKTAFIAVGLIIVVAILAFSAKRQRTPATQYFTAQAASGPLRNVVNATGVVQTVVTVQVGSQVSGQVDELYADFNSVVKRGQLLAKLDPRNFQAQVENAQASVAAARARIRSAEADQKTQIANLQSARANLEAARVTRDNTAVLFQRAAELTKSGVASRNDYDNAKANADSAEAKFEQAQASIAQVEAQSNASAAQLEQAKAQLQQAEADLARAKLNLDYCNIYSPVDGVVISRNVDVGQTIAASLQSPTLFTIANDLTRMQVNANIDEADIGNISDRADVRFTIDAYPNESFRGRISEIRLNPQTVQNVVTYSVILSVENPEMKLKPGMTANITITVAQRGNVLRVPNAALRYTPAGAHREESGPEHGPAVVTETETAETAETDGATQFARRWEAPPVHLAPGQKWDPSQKIKFSAPKRVTQRPGVVFVLDAQQKPQPKKVLLGITDGTATEVISGEIDDGAAVIIGDSNQSAQVQTTPARGPFLFGGGGGPGGGGGRGRGN